MQIQTDQDFFFEEASKLGVEASGLLWDRVKSYAESMIRWNKTYNLSTAARTLKEVIERHVLDSMAILPFIPESGRLLDVGSGAGFPGMPIAWVRPDVKVALLDSNSKKTAFMRQMIAALDLTNVGVVQKRVEQYHPKLPFDVVVSRAFSTVRLFVDMASHLCAPNGSMVAMKGQWPGDEGLQLTIPVDVHPLPSALGARHAIMIHASVLQGDYDG